MNKSDISKNILTITAVSLILGLTACSSPVITDHTDSNILFENDNNSLDGKTINDDNVTVTGNAQYPDIQDNGSQPSFAEGSDISEASAVSGNSSSQEGVFTDDGLTGSGSRDTLPDSGDSYGSQNEEPGISSDTLPDSSDSYGSQNEEPGISSDTLPDSGDSYGSQNEESDGSHTEGSFYCTRITPEIYDRISGKSYPADTDSCRVSLDELSYCHVLFCGFDGLTHEGELIVNADIANDILDIFEELYINRYPIERMVLIDEYDANDEMSMRDNNTSAFNYRVISGSTTLSNHSYGLAIDINPLYNPYVVKKSNGETEVQPATAGDYVDRTNGNPHYILKDDLCYRLFIEHGFTWGGDWNTKKDYQHFEKKRE